MLVQTPLVFLENKEDKCEGEVKGKNQQAILRINPRSLVNPISQVLTLSPPGPHCQNLSLKTNIYVMFIMCQLLSMGFNFIILRKLII